MNSFDNVARKGIHLEHSALRRAACLGVAFLLGAGLALGQGGPGPKGTRPFERTVIVSPVVGDPAASGAALLSALAGITGASASDPWLLKVEPASMTSGRPRWT